MRVIRPLDNHMIRQLKLIYGWTVSDEELLRGIREVYPAAMGEETVLVVRYGTESYIIPTMTEPTSNEVG